MTGVQAHKGNMMDFPRYDQGNDERQWLGVFENVVSESLKNLKKRGQ